jgi:hypothetical protein
MAVSSLANSRTNVALESGNALAHPLPGLNDFVGALDAAMRSLLVVRRVSCQNVFYLAPVLIVVSGDSSLRDLDDVCHGFPPLKSEVIKALLPIYEYSRVFR